MMPPRVTIVSGLQVIDNPRVVKEADAFAEMGWDVEVLGAIFDEASKARIVALHTGRRWRHTAVVDLTNAHILPKSAIFLRRGGARASRILKRRLGYDHPLQLSFLTGALAKHALARHANLFSLHTEAALWPADCWLSTTGPYASTLKIGIPKMGCQQIAPRARSL